MNIFNRALNTEKGVAKILPVLMIVSAVALLAFLLISSTAPFKESLIGKLFQKPFSHAASDPVIQQYYIEFQPYIGVIMSKTGVNGYSELAILKDMQGNVVTDQRDFSYVWSIDTFGSPIATIDPFSACTFGIITPCPKDHVAINTLPNPSTSSTNIRVAIYRNSDQSKVAEGMFPLNLVDGPVYNFQVTAPVGGESFKVGQDVNITWDNGTTPVDYYNIGYLYYKNGILSSGYIGTAMWGSSNLHWIIPQELANQKVKIWMDPRLNGISVGQDTSDNFFSVRPASITLTSKIIQTTVGGTGMGIEYDWSPALPTITGSLMIFNGNTCKSFASGYGPGELAGSAGIGMSTQFVFANPQVTKGKTFCAQIWSDFYGGVSDSNPSVIIIGIDGDIDLDGHVTIFDFNTLVTNFGKTGTDIPGDVDGNGKVDIFDYNIVVENFGR